MNKDAVSEKLRANYQDYYETGGSEWRRLGALGKADNIVTLCSSFPHGTILDIGAGEGSVLRRLSELGFGEELYALEISPSGVKTIEDSSIPRLAEVALFDGYSIPATDNRYDLAILSHVVEHVEHPRKLIYEASRVAKYLFIEVPLEDTLRLPPNFTFDSVGHINFYSPKTFRQLIQSCNLTVVRQITTNPSKQSYSFKKGYKGTLNYYVKQLLLKTSPSVATKLFTYHGALVCMKNAS